MAILSPSPKLQFFDANGNPLVGGKLYTYAAGTTTPLASYTDSSGGTANANPIILDSRGEANVWLASGTAYKFVLQSAASATIWTVDNIDATLGTMASQNANNVAITGGSVSVSTLTTSSTVTLNGGTANGVAYLNGSKVVTSGSALVFDGTNLGLGVTPSAWDGGWSAIQTSTQGASFTGRTGGNEAIVLSNAYRNSASWKYILSSNASMYQAGNGIHAWFIAPSGTAGNAITFTQAMTLDASGNLGVGTTSPNGKLSVAGNITLEPGGSGPVASSRPQLWRGADGFLGIQSGGDTGGVIAFHTSSSGTPAERARIDSSGNLLVGKTSVDDSVAGVTLQSAGTVRCSRADSLAVFNRLSTDGTLVEFLQAGTLEGSISVSGTTVSYNGGHLSRYAQTVGAKDESIVKGTVLSNLDEMNTYTDADGNAADNEQLNKVKVSDIEGDANVAGVFVNWSHDEDHNVDEINMAMTGDMIIRIAQGTTVQRGDLLMSAGNGTAKPQGDDIIRSKTVAKVTSTHVTCTYADGSYCVPCVLMAC
jgi:hypothetical protein